MADQVINEDNDIIQSVFTSSWYRGACPPEWFYGLIPTTQLEADTEMGDFNGI